MPSERRRPQWVIEPLDKEHDRASFSCGQPVLDRYLKQLARQDARRHASAPFVLVPKSADPTILGFYTLSSFSVELRERPRTTIKKLPAYPDVPAVLLGRLAVDQHHTRKGVGEFLLMDALQRALVHAAETAAVAVVVDAIDVDAVRFYEHFDFIPFPDRQDRLFLPMRTIERLFR